MYEGYVSFVLCFVLIWDGESVILGLEDKIVKVWYLKIKNCVIFKGYGGMCNFDYFILN